MATCSLIQTSGALCANEPDPDSFFDICTEHWAQIIEDHARRITEPHLLAEVSCPVCRRTILTGPGAPVACANPHCWEDAWWSQPAPDETTETRNGTAWIYYIRFGDRIKIGTTTSLKGRLASLPHDEILALEPGSYDLERARHREFAPMLVDGQREWFHDSSTLRDHALELRARHGSPEDLMRAA